MTLIIFLLSITTDSLFAADRVYLFAEHLYEEGDYPAALAEFRRYRFLADPLAGDVPEKIVRCLAAMERFPEALAESGRLAPAARKELLTGWIYFMAGKYDSTRFVLDRGGSPLSGEAGKLVGLSYAEEYDFKHAAGYLALPPPTAGRRSLWAAAALSLIPGGGHYYAGKFDDGIYSTLIVGTASLLAYYYHGQREGLKFGLTLSAAVVFYAGSIYGGLNACQNHNRFLDEQYLERIREENALKIK
jgi:hypothetical protein